ncbi:flippase [Clostridium grantii]|uniref:Membrane protein involved in the export of O-antigen and teichoic acid n=1 Tax=Clostridium grantii DSM 8605 TaxID=1121316 RepID=A0A1M5RL13_9CLOT|nr:flippase [Clostridium grantii]SHH26768.1 Membrane protein involved in the export of O-antigen and teichoic acid [Clostridium grantii DSM 8605]
MGNDSKNSLRFLLKNTSLVFVMKIFGMGLAFVFQMLMGRLLGPNYYGEYTIYITIVNIFCLFTVLGTDNSLIRTIPRISSDDRLKFTLLKKILSMVFVNSIFISILMMIFKKELCSFFNVSDERYIIVTFLILILVSLSKVIDGFLQGEKKTIISTFFNTALINLFRIIFFFAFYMLNGKNIISALLAYLVTEFILLVLRILYIRKYKLNQNFTKETIYDKQEYFHFIKYSISLFIIMGIDIVMRSIDKIMIKAYIGYEQVGIYKAAENYLGLVAVFITPFVVFWPMISDMYKEKQIKKINEMFSIIIKIVSLLSLPVIIFMIVFSKDLLGFFGEAYVYGYPVLFLLLIGNVFDALAGPVGALLNMTEYAKYNLINMVLLLVMNVILNFLLIPKYGVNGAAIATSISLVTINSVNIIQNKILLNVFPYKKDTFFFLAFSVIIYFVDKKLYNTIDVNIFIKMIIFIIINYVIMITLYVGILRPNLREMYNTVKRKK